MPICPFCSESVASGLDLCPMCGMVLDTSPSMPVAAVVPEAIPMGEVIEGVPVAELRRCPSCDKTYDAGYADEFCACGGELVEIATLPRDNDSVSLESSRPKASAERPPPGTKCFVLYGADKKPVSYFPLCKDVTLIGRLDAVEGVFPDIDVTQWVGKKQARRVSRKHALVMRSRADDSIQLRPLSGNTGTQIENEMVEPLSNHVLEPGRRVILGGTVRLKYEVIE